MILQPDTNIDNILVDNPTETLFEFLAGNYYITKVLHIHNKPNIQFISTSTGSVHIFQQEQFDGLSVKNSNSFIMRNISLHVEAPDKISLTIAQCSNTVVEHCYFYGNNNYFAVFYAGPDVLAGQPTLDTFTNNVLDSNNIFRNNVVYTKWSGDNVSFSLQKNGLVEGNLIRGGKIAVYMCKDSLITKNKIMESTSQGIYVSNPTINVTLRNNEIYESDYSAIKVANQVEHGTFTPVRSKLNIVGNKIYDAKVYAIELNNTKYINIASNKLVSTERYCIYMYNCHHINVIKNKLTTFLVGLWNEDCTYIKMDNNTFNSVYPDESVHGVKDVNCMNNRVINNKFNGKYTHDIIITGLGSVVMNNVIQLYYNHVTEVKPIF